MNKKIVAGALLGALSLGVGLNVIPEVNYQEGVKSKEVVNIKRTLNQKKYIVTDSVNFSKVGDFSSYYTFDGDTTFSIKQSGWYIISLDRASGMYDNAFTEISHGNSIDQEQNGVISDSGLYSNFFDDSHLYVYSSRPDGNTFFIDNGNNGVNKYGSEFKLSNYQNVYDGGLHDILVYVETPTDIIIGNTEDQFGGYGDFTYDIKYKLNISEFDGVAPSLTGTNNFVVNVNNMLTIDNILSHMSAYDETDGKLQVQLESNGTTYNPNNKKIGNYLVKAYAQDRAGNRTNVDITVNVVDIDKPVISGSSSYTRSYDNPITLDAVKQALTISDNYDTNLQLQVVTDNYTGHERELGNKTITFKTVDSSNNESSVFTVTIKVEDKIPPVISGAGEVKISSNSPISLETFKSKFTVSDALEGTLTLNVAGFENYLKDTKLSTTHVITLSAQDSSGNRVEKKVNLVVEDRIAPEIFLDNYFIVLQQGQTLTKEQLIEYASKSLGVSVDAIAEVSGEYDVSTPGTYKLSARLVTGETYEISLGVQEAPKEYKERAMKWYEYLYKWVTVLFNIEDGYYHIDSFFNFGTRCKKIGELYSTGIYKELIK